MQMFNRVERASSWVDVTLGMSNAKKQAYLKAKEVEGKGKKSSSVLGPEDKEAFNFDEGVSVTTMHPKTAEEASTVYSWREEATLGST